MVEVAFYHLTKFRLEEALPKLLEKTYALGKKAHVQVGSVERCETLADHLWSYNPDSWLPHGTSKDGQAADQPIWITDQDINENKAEFLFLSDGLMSQNLDQYERCFILFDGRLEDHVQQARKQWKELKDNGLDLTYWQQNDRGGWEKKA